jgi:hypothetical protein
MRSELTDDLGEAGVSLHVRYEEDHSGFWEVVVNG